MIRYYEEADRILDDAYENAADYRALDLTHVIRMRKHVCLFGSGKVFSDSLQYLQKLHSCKVDYVCDNNPAKWGRIFLGVKCLSIDELRAMKEDTVIVITVDLWMPIARQLKQEGFKYVYPLWRWIYGNCSKFDSPGWLRNAKKPFKQLLSVLHDDFSRKIAITELKNKLARDILQIDYTPLLVPGTEYFPEDIITLGNSECFVDGGAFDGDTLLSFLKHCNNQFDHSYHFELDARNYALLLNTIANLPEGLRSRITAFPFGMWHKSREVSFQGEGGGSTISNSPKATLSGYVRSLDEVFKGKKITMIKMDIEAAEVNALKGAFNIITSQRPKLAICVYHRLEDLWEVPLLIKKMYYGYRVYLRHYSKLDWGNVCYAVAPNGG
jgi:FkbM family methyltransferase